MKTFFLSLALLSLPFAWLSAQDIPPVRDTMSYHQLMINLSGSVSASDSIDLAMVKQIEKNKKRKIQGYRIRIYFDNSQNARMVSQQIEEQFSSQYPDIPIYRVYANPYFKVTVGDFRSKSHAMKFLNEIIYKYPTAFLVKEAFSTI